MNPDHIVLIEPVRAYLLGKLDDQTASVLEQRYFTDRSFFLRVREIETALIQDYVAGRLASTDKHLFENRYLTVPEMRRRLEEVRRLGGTPVHDVAHQSASSWRPVLV